MKIWLTFIFTFYSLLVYSDGEFVASTSDVFCFGKMWKHLHSLKEGGKLHSAIAERRVEIQSLKDHWKERFVIEKSGPYNEFYHDIAETVQSGSLQPVQEGAGCAHLLIDEKGVPRFIIKPVDGEILCLNNAKCYGNPLIEKNFRARSAIPLYHSAQIDALVYECAELLGVASITPKTVIDVVKSEVFYDISDSLDALEKETFFQETGPVDREKLCSVQEYIADSQELAKWYRSHRKQGKTEENIAQMINQEDFENIHLLIWVSYDNDAHAGNIRVVKSVDGAWHLRKVDNALSFPETNTHFLNTLSMFPNAREKLSALAKQRIEAFPIYKCIALMYHYEMRYAILAFIERIHLLKELAHSNLSIREIDQRMKLLNSSSDQKAAG